MLEGMTRDGLAAYRELMEAKEEAGQVPCQNYPDAFFPDLGDSGAVTEWAKEACGTCPIRTQCLNFALVNNETHGIWGGTSPRMRLKLRRHARVA